MKIVLAILALTASAAQAQVTNDPCYLCGEGMELADKESLPALPGFPALTCGQYEANALAGVYDVVFCSGLSAIATSCGCQALQATGAPVAAPVTAAPTDAPFVFPDVEDPNPVCDFCGDGLNSFTNTDGTIQVAPGFPVITCAEFSRAGLAGLIDPVYCSGIVSSVSAGCGCPTAAPVTPAPVAPVTPAPVATFQPVDAENPECVFCAGMGSFQDPDAVVVIPGFPNIACSEFLRASSAGLIDPVYCSGIVAQVNEQCSCPATPAPITPAPVTPAPVVPTTPAPVTPAPVTAAPVTSSPVTTFPPVDAENPECVFCDGNGDFTSDGLVVLPGFPEISCSEYARASAAGLIDIVYCSGIVAQVNAQCGCPPPPTDTPPISSPIPPSPGYPPCNVCDPTDPSIRITLPDVIVNITGQPESTCGALELAGAFGFIDPGFCPIMPGFVGECGCEVAPDTPAPVTLPPALGPIPPSPGFPPCNVCGEGLEITNPDFVVEIPGQRPATCSAFALAGTGGFIDPDTCPAIPGLIMGCGCAAISGAPVTAAPVTAAPVTPAPVTAAPVTPAPVTAAPVTPAPVTPAPVTPAPTPNPTRAPIVPPVTPAPVTPAPTEGKKGKKGKNDRKGKKDKDD